LFNGKANIVDVLGQSIKFPVTARREKEKKLRKTLNFTQNRLLIFGLTLKKITIDTYMKFFLNVYT